MTLITTQKIFWFLEPAEIYCFHELFNHLSTDEKSDGMMESVKLDSQNFSEIHIYTEHFSKLGLFGQRIFLSMIDKFSSYFSFIK